MLRRIARGKRTMYRPFPFLAKGVGRGGLGDLTSSLEPLPAASQLRDSAGLAPASPGAPPAHRAGAVPPLERSLAFTTRAEQPALRECRIRENDASSSALRTNRASSGAG